MNKKDKFQRAKEHFELGIKLIRSKKYDEAKNEFYNSLKIIPDRNSTINNLISIFLEVKDTIGLENFLETIDKNKNKIQCEFGNASLEYLKKNYDVSINICINLLKNIKKKDDINIQIIDLLSSNYLEKKEFLNSVKIYKKILNNNNNYYMVYYNIGSLLQYLGKERQAYFYLKKAIEINPNDKSVLWNLSLCFLKLGNLTQGFKLYENRWYKKEPEKKKFTQIKSVENINEIINKKILIWDEQGLGDTIQFSRFVIDLLKYTKKITLVVNSKLKDLISLIHKDIAVEDYNSLNSQDYEYQIALCSIPYLINIRNMEDINYKKLVIPFNNKINQNLFDNNKLNIGIAWSGSPNYVRDKFRSISFSNFKEIIEIKNVNYFKLFKGIKSEEVSKLNFYNIIDLGEKNFRELSDYILQLDLVISSDTSIIHLCGILNVPTIMLLNYNSDWRWFNDKYSTPWYPNIKIIKQEKLNDWSSVFNKAKIIIEDFKKKKLKNN